EKFDRGQIEVDYITKSFDSDAGNILALDGINLEVVPQEFITLVGRSGCGKSTLLRCIGGLISPSTGTIKISGQVVTEPHPQIG
ncbi:TPA: nitrate/sulfonate/bicarbonate ABC transporter ATP-binding protein, partial [Candidatus Peribacteria bacterium]|nr:nitrate/sulfonate/bicarbonate ABC transporter ATP-binding protein [Candidatus Peribacteria bacterium]